jgi:hypothetical protein
MYFIFSKMKAKDLFRMLIFIYWSAMIIVIISLPVQTNSQNYHFSNGWMPGKRSITKVITSLHTQSEYNKRLPSLNFIFQSLLVSHSFDFSYKKQNNIDVAYHNVMCECMAQICSTMTRICRKLFVVYEV